MKRFFPRILLIALAAILCLMNGAAAQSPVTSGAIPMIDDMDYEEICKWAEAYYGFEGYFTSMFSPYDPMYIDPVGHFHWINHHDGLKGNERYIIQAGRSADHLTTYLDFLKGFGYRCTEEARDENGERHTFALPDKYAGTATIPPVVTVEYLYNMELIMVRYDDGYAAINRAWRVREMTSEVSSAPVTADMQQGGTLTLHRNIFTDTVDCNNIPLTSPLYNILYDRWDDWGIQCCVSETTFDASIFKSESHWAKYRDAHALVLEISLEGADFDPARCFLVERAPDEGVVLSAPLFWGAMASGYQTDLTLDMAAEDDRLWLAFQVQRYDPDMPLRLYLDLSGDEEGSPIENWSYVDFMPIY